jgi:HPt (histidine-containing phosphotransfer) domain-containing protein
MPDDTIDASTFADLQANAGADFVRELIDTFFEEAPTMLDALRNALAASDAEAFRRAAHSLKSNAQTFGAAALGAQARTLETSGLAAGPAALDALLQDYERARAALTALRDQEVGDE